MNLDNVKYVRALAADKRAVWVPAPGQPHGWIQWKATEVCMDFVCSCGNSGHIDAGFVYFVRCERCGRVYRLPGYVEAVELTGQEIAMLQEEDFPCTFTMECGHEHVSSPGR